MRFWLLACLAGILSAQFTGGTSPKPFREYPGTEYTDFALPKDWNEPHDWVRARLKYVASSRPYRGRYRSRPNVWTTDYPRSDRHLLAGVRRLTRIDSQSVEQVTELDGTDDIYNWPMLYAVEVGQWSMPGDQGPMLRDFIDRGGFLMVDDFHGTQEWDVFLEGINKVFPDKRIVELDNKDAIFHTLYDLDDRFQVPGEGANRSGRTYEVDGYEARWRGIYDDKGRIVVAVCHNMDLGDAWEWSDDPSYPERFASLAYRIAMNYFVYDLTH
jgi:hypothetical protein